MSARQVHLDRAGCLTDEAAAALAGTFLDDASWNVLIDDDADVYRPDGSLLLSYRRHALSAEVCRKGWTALRPAAVKTDNRGLAAGVTEPPPGAVRSGNVRFCTRKADGTRSATSYGGVAQSGITGYFDRSARRPFCRQTAYTAEQPERWAGALPLLRGISEAFRATVPDRFAAQLAMIERVPPEFRITGTVFTTVTVNLNWRTAVHQDKGDLPEGLGVMIAIRRGPYGGAYTVWPQYRVAVDLRTRGVVLADVHEWHGNTPFRGKEGGWERLSLVLYMRKNMVACETPAVELERVKRRQRETRLNP